MLVTVIAYIAVMIIAFVWLLNKLVQKTAPKSIKRELGLLLILTGYIILMIPPTHFYIVPRLWEWANK